MIRIVIVTVATFVFLKVSASPQCSDAFADFTQNDVLIFGMKRLQNDPLYFRLHEEMQIDPRAQPVLNDLEIMAFEMVFYLRNLKSLEQTMALASRDEIANLSEFKGWYVHNMDSHFLAIHSVAGEFAFRAWELVKISQLEAEIMISHLLDQVEQAFKRVKIDHPLHHEVRSLVGRMREDTTLHVP